MVFSCIKFALLLALVSIPSVPI